MWAIVRQGANYIITLIVLNVSLLIKNQLSLHNIVKTPSAQNFMHTVRGIIIGKEPLLVNMLEVCGQWQSAPVLQQLAVTWQVILL